MGEKVLFKDKFQVYSKKGDIAGRDTEDFETLVSIATMNLEQRLDILLCNRKLEDLTTDAQAFTPSERAEHESKQCNGVKEETENPICKCMFYYDKKEISCRECNNNNVECAIEKPWTNISDDYEVIDYQYPMPYKHAVKDIGKVDLVLIDKHTDEVYGVEMKPPKGNNESLSRMAAETLTYTSVLETAGKFGCKNGKKLKPAIAFFEDSIQEKKFKEYFHSDNKAFIDLFKTIKVFVVYYSRKERVTEFEFRSLDIKNLDS